MKEKIYITNDEMIKKLGELLDEQTEDVVMSEKVRQVVQTIYNTLVAIENNDW